MRSLQALATAGGLALALVVPANLTPAGAAPSQVQEPHTTCTAATEVLTLTFSPPLGLLQKDTKFKQGRDEPTGLCTGDFTGTLTLQNVHGNGDLSCTTSSGVSGDANLKWGDGTNSHVKISGFGIEGAPSSVSKVVVISGSVTSGRFAGDEAVITFTATVSDTTKCLNDDLSSLAGHPTTTFTTEPATTR